MTTYYFYNVGRIKRGTGEKHHAAKLTWEKVSQIRKQYALGNITQRQLAAQFNVSPSQITRILQNKSWKK